MPRPRAVNDLEPLGAEDLGPVEVGTRSNVGSALNGIITVANSTQMRQTLMVGSGFPLQGDLPAFLMLNQLVYRGAARPTDMADAIQTSRSNVSRIATRLEHAGLIMRTPDPEDQRALVVALTPTGRSVGERIILLAEQLFVGALHEWSDEELFFLEKLVVKLARTMDTAADHFVAYTLNV